MSNTLSIMRVSGGTVSTRQSRLLAPGAEQIEAILK